MVLKETLLLSLDNSGAKKVKCIHLFSGSSKKQGKLGDILKVSLRKKDVSKNLNKKLYCAILVTSCLITRRLNGHFIKFDKNKIVLLSEKKEVLATRLLRPISKEVKLSKLTKILAMSFCII